MNGRVSRVRAEPAEEERVWSASGGGKLTPRPGSPQGLAVRIFGKRGVASGTRGIDGKIISTLVFPPNSEPVDRNKRGRQMEVNTGLVPDRAVLPRCVVGMGQARRGAALGFGHGPPDSAGTSLACSWVPQPPSRAGPRLGCRPAENRLAVPSAGRGGGGEWGAWRGLSGTLSLYSFLLKEGSLRRGVRAPQKACRGGRNS